MTGANQRRLDGIGARAWDVTDKAARDAQCIVAILNSRRERGASNSSARPIAAAYPWVTFICSACQQIGEIDFHTPDRHPNATVESLIPSLG